VDDWTYDQTQQFIDFVWKDYFGAQKAPPRLIRRASLNSAANDQTIELSRGGRNRETVLHELAHVIMYAVYGEDKTIEGHGPQYLRLFVELLVFYADYDRDWLNHSIKSCGLRMAGRVAIRRRNCLSSWRACQKNDVHQADDAQPDRWMRQGRN